MNVTVARQGGNRLTAYNWENNASNAGSDWHHQNDSNMGETNEPGWASKTFLTAAQNHGAAVLLAVPCAGYVAADKNGDGDVINTPNYLNVRFVKSYAKKPGGKFVYPPDTTDKAVYQDEYVNWVEKIKSPKTPVWYSLDNEPDCWEGTHKRIWPKNPTYAQMTAINIDFAKAIKDVAPNTYIFGPVNYGWMGFHSFGNAPDANGRDFIDFYLSSMKEAEKKFGKRLLDVLDIHWYPEVYADGTRITGNVDKPSSQEARIQAPRSLWDSTYVENSWIANDVLGKKPIVLIPTIMKQIETHYPGTKFAITEYNYGGGRVMSGALAQADVLGIYGRYGVFAACNWGLGAEAVSQVAGFQSYLNYDGKGSHFGDLGLAVSGEDAAANSVYAALDSKNNKRLTMVAINKTSQPSPMQFAFKGYKATSAKGYAISAANFTTQYPVTVNVANGTVSYNMPPLSVTTIEVGQ